MLLPTCSLLPALYLESAIELPADAPSSIGHAALATRPVLFLCSDPAVHQGAHGSPRRTRSLLLSLASAQISLPATCTDERLDVEPPTVRAPRHLDERLYTLVVVDPYAALTHRRRARHGEHGVLGVHTLDRAQHPARHAHALRAQPRLAARSQRAGAGLRSAVPAAGLTLSTTGASPPRVRPCPPDARRYTVFLLRQLGALNAAPGLRPAREARPALPGRADIAHRVPAAPARRAAGSPCVGRPRGPERGPERHSRRHTAGRHAGLPGPMGRREVRGSVPMSVRTGAGVTAQWRAQEGGRDWRRGVCVPR